MNVNRLKGKIVENGLNITAVAKEMGIDRATLYRKLNNKGETLTIREAQNLVKILDINPDEATSIFFGHNVALNAN